MFVLRLIDYELYFVLYFSTTSRFGCWRLKLRES